MKISTSFSAAIAFAETCSVEVKHSNQERMIVNGSDVHDPTHYPFMASLQREMAGGSGKVTHICGASIISPTMLLSAAHCFWDGYPINLHSVRVGSNFRQSGGTFPIKVARVTAHPLNTRQFNDYDVAIVRLATPLQYSDTVKPIALAKAFAETASGYNLTVLGWGVSQWKQSGNYSKTLQEVTVPVVSRADCQAVYAGSTYKVTNRSMCAGFSEGGFDACYGDSGGPLFDRDADGVRLVGIVSWGRLCALPGFPGVYTSLANEELANWIEHYLSNPDAE